MDEQGTLHDAPISRVPLTVVDVETTGLSAGFDRVVEIALLRVHLVGGEAVIREQFTSLVNPGRDIPRDAQAVHHISTAMVWNQPSFARLLDAINPFLADGALVGHNVGFDLGFLRAELRRAGASEPALPAIDTLALARRYLRLGSYSLSAVARRLGLPAGVHRALGDARLTLAVLAHLIERIRQQQGGTEPRLEDLVNPGRPTLPRPVSPWGPLPAPAPVDLPFRIGQRLFLRYTSPTSGPSERVVDVMEINVEGGVASLYAYCHRSRDMRTFRLDRIVAWEEVKE